MDANKPEDRQVNQYDKILKENLEVALPGLIRDLLGIHVVYDEELPDDIQHTKERKPDVLKKIRDDTGDAFILHIEFQVESEPDMVFRMAEYFIMLTRKYRHPVRQYVIYIGRGHPQKMVDQIYYQDQFFFRYKLIVLSSVGYQLLLNSDKPEEKILAILADFGKESPSHVIEMITRQVADSVDGDFAKSRLLKQLRILAQPA